MPELLIKTEAGNIAVVHDESRILDQFSRDWPGVFQFSDSADVGISLDLVDDYNCGLLIRRGRWEVESAENALFMSAAHGLATLSTMPQASSDACVLLCSWLRPTPADESVEIGLLLLTPPRETERDSLEPNFLSLLPSSSQASPATPASTN